MAQAKATLIGTTPSQVTWLVELSDGSSYYVTTHIGSDLIHVAPTVDGDRFTDDQAAPLLPEIRAAIAAATGN